MSSLRVYLSEEGKEKIEKMPGFYKTGINKEQWHVSEIILTHDTGCCFLTLNEVLDPIPSKIASFVEEVTLRDCHRASKRESGIYRHKTAKAEVTMDNSGLSVSIFIRGKSREDVLNLLEKIKTGTIRPEESYESPQDGMSSKEIRAKLTELEHINSDLHNQVTKISNYAFTLRAEVKNYIFTLRESRMPIIFPQTAIDKLESILVNPDL